MLVIQLARHARNRSGPQRSNGQSMCCIDPSQPLIAAATSMAMRAHMRSSYATAGRGRAHARRQRQQDDLAWPALLLSACKAWLAVLRPQASGLSKSTSPGTFRSSPNMCNAAPQPRTCVREGDHCGPHMHLTTRPSWISRRCEGVAIFRLQRGRLQQPAWHETHA